MTRPLAYNSFWVIILCKHKYSIQIQSGLSSSPKCFSFFSLFGLHLKLKHCCCAESLCPPSLQGDEIIALKIKLLTTNRWCVDTRPVSEHASSRRNKSGVSTKFWSLSSKENWEQYPEIKRKMMLIQFLWENTYLLQSQLHDKESVYCSLN